MKLHRICENDVVWF